MVLQQGLVNAGFEEQIQTLVFVANVNFCRQGSILILLLSSFTFLRRMLALRKPTICFKQLIFAQPLLFKRVDIAASWLSLIKPD